LNLRPLGPEPDAEGVQPLAGVRRLSQPLDATQDLDRDPEQSLPQDPPYGTDGNGPANQVAADLRRTELLRPELLLSVACVAQRLGVSVATVHNRINAGELRCHLFGSVRRIKPEDLKLYIRTTRDEGFDVRKGQRARMQTRR
jgi:excisionase family DNA binding protein